MEQERKARISFKPSGIKEQNRSPILNEHTSGVSADAPLNRRANRREPLNIKVFFQVPGKELSSLSANISPSGMKISLSTVITPGTPLALHFSFDELCFLKLAGQVVYRHSVSNGMNEIGVQFLAVRDWGKKILSSVINELKDNSSMLKKSFATIHASKDNLALEAALLSKENPESQTVPPNSDGEAQTVAQASVNADRSMKTTSNRSRKFTPNPPWVIDMNRHLDPYRQAIWQSKLVQETSAGELSLAQVRGWSIQFYPFIEHFPQFMATYLAKATDPMSRAFLINNLRVEKRHADQWIDMAEGFGVPKKELFKTPIIPEVEALTHWMWSITNRGSFVESVAAANFAIEGVTQGIASIMVKGFSKYHSSQGVILKKKSYYWMESHAHYDDLHPYEALEVIKVHANSAEIQQKVTHAAQRSLEYLFGALEACYWAYAPEIVRA